MKAIETKKGDPVKFITGDHMNPIVVHAMVLRVGRIWATLLTSGNVKKRVRLSELLHDK